MTQYNNDLQKWKQSNIFLKNQEFSNMQMSLVPIKILQGSFQTYSTQVTPQNNQYWKHIILLPGTAFKFSNKINAKYTAKSLISILDIKNIPTKIYTISHRINPIYPEAQTDTLEMLQIILQKQQIKSAYILTWSAGSCYLQQVIQLMQKKQCDVKKLFLVSPMIDLFAKERTKTADFLSKDFFEFVQKVYCKEDLKKVQKLSLVCSLRKQKEQNFIVKYSTNIIYGSQQYITQDIEEYIKLLNQYKRVKNMDKIETKCILGQNHALYSFVTTKETRQNAQAMNKIAKVKWQVSKYITDCIEQSSQVFKQKICNQNQN